MNNYRNPSLLVIAGAVLFSLVFWQEKLGINTILFDAFILAAIFYLYAEARQNAAVRWLLFGHLLCLAMIMLHNTLLSKIAFVVTLAMIAGFASYYHRSAWFAGGSILLKAISFPASFIEQFRFVRRKKRRTGNLSKAIRFAIIPVLLLIVFFIIYLFANSIFLELASGIGAKLEDLFMAFFNQVSWQWCLFLLLGLYITGVILLRSKWQYFTKKEQQFRDDLLRTKRSWAARMSNPLYNLLETVMGRLVSGMMALKNEHTTGLISLVLLNSLLLVINTIDISYLWFNFNYNGEILLYKMVHEGTELLIVSIVLAMLVLLFFFKGNLNFYKRNRWLKVGAYLWIAQNIVLVISVFLRDYYYIVYYGLAYKRIGVLFFLLMVLIGLATVFLKIWQRKTTYFLFRVNAWAGIVVLILASCIHWDEFIAGYNLQRKDKVPLDVAFLLSLSDKTLPLLDQNRTAIQQRQDELSKGKLTGAFFTPGICDTCFVEKLQDRELVFMDQQQKFSWLSWNYADDYVKKYFRQAMVLPPAPHH